MEEKERTHFAWIDRKRRIVSFRYAEGFEEMRFATHEEMFSYVIGKTDLGFRLQ